MARIEKPKPKAAGPVGPHYLQPALANRLLCDVLLARCPKHRFRTRLSNLSPTFDVDYPVVRVFGVGYALSGDLDVGMLSATTSDRWKAVMRVDDCRLYTVDGNPPRQLGTVADVEFADQ